jgi:hypothetical protein
MSWLTLYVLAFSTPTTIYITEYLFIQCISMYEVGLKKYAIVALLLVFVTRALLEYEFLPIWATIPSEPTFLDLIIGV